MLITSEYRRHGELLNSPYVLNRDYYERIAAGSADRNQLDISLRELTKMLHEHYGIAPIVIIDEYDTPIQQGFAKGFYEDTVDFMRNLFSGAFKDNDHLTYGFLLVAGYLKLAKLDMSSSGDFICKVSLPNREIAYVYKKEVIGRLSSIVP